MCKEIMDILDKIKYGYIDINNTIHNCVDKDFDKLYRLQTPEETLNNKVGICFDQVELERKLFEDNNYIFNSYFIVYYDNDKFPAHSFIIYKENNKYYWFEHSWNKYKGIKEYSSEGDALKDIKNKFINDELNGKYNFMNLCIYKYSKPRYGIESLDFYKHCESFENIIIS